MYNIHPILVHFPIALLFIYSVIKILPVEKWFPQFAWRDVERLFLFFGVLGAFGASATGEIAEELIRTNHQLVESHAFFAGLSTWLYGALLIGGILSFLNTKLISLNLLTPPVLNFTQKLIIPLEKLLSHTTFSKIIAFIALIAISVTGLLGGVIVYGTSADPLAGIVLQILGITL